MPSKITFLLGLLIPFTAISDELEKRRHAPNVLFIVIDDLKPLLGCYGEKIAKTPNIDRLASMGIVFKNFYCQQAVCGPSRANLLTGMRPDYTKIWDLATKMRDVNPDIITLPQYFRMNGYETAGIGKVFDNRCVDRDLDKPSWSIPYHRKSDKYYAKETSKIGSQLQDPEVTRKIDVVTNEGKAKGLSRAELQKFVRKSTYPSVECLDAPDNTYPDGAHVLHANDILAELSKKDKPFFLAVGINKPHLPFAAPKKYWDLYDRKKLPLAAFRDNSKGTPRVAYQDGGELYNYTDIPPVATRSRDSGGLKLPEEKQKELIHGYFAATSFADALVGKLLKQVESLGILENTIIVVVGDHGWHLGDHNMWCKHSNFEQAVRTPLIISAPGIRASTTNSPAEFIDVFPTLAELAGLEKPHRIEGKSLASILNEPNARVKEYAISQYPRGSKSGRVMGYSLRTDDHRYTVWMNKGWVSTMPYDGALQIESELYDYKSDPLETRNLVADPDYTDIAKNMHLKMLGFFKSQEK